MQELHHLILYFLNKCSAPALKFQKCISLVPYRVASHTSSNILQPSYSQNKNSSTRKYFIQIMKGIYCLPSAMFYVSMLYTHTERYGCLCVEAASVRYSSFGGLGHV